MKEVTYHCARMSAGRLRASRRLPPNRFTLSVLPMCAWLAAQRGQLYSGTEALEPSALNATYRERRRQTSATRRRLSTPRRLRRTSRVRPRRVRPTGTRSGLVASRCLRTSLISGKGTRLD